MTAPEQYENFNRFAHYLSDSDYLLNHFSMSTYARIDMKAELIWLYTFLEVKAEENKQRTGKEPSKEYLQQIETIKRASLFITCFSQLMDKVEEKLSRDKKIIDDLRRQIIALRKQDDF